MTAFVVKRVLDIKAELGESPAWCAEDQCLYWIDIHKTTINRFEPKRGINKAWPLPSKPGCFAFRENNGAVIAAQDGIYDVDFSSGNITHVSAPPFDPAVYRFNDGRTDRQGRLWVGSLRANFAEFRPGEGVMYRYDGTEFVKGIAPISIANGTAFSPDGRIMYRAESLERRIYAYDYDSVSGNASNARVFVDLPLLDQVGGTPDGATVDSQGGYWVALPRGKRTGEIARFTTDGNLDVLFEVPVMMPTMVAFGGPTMSTLYITSGKTAHIPETMTEFAGDIFAVETRFRGIPETKFRRP